MSQMWNIYQYCPELNYPIFIKFAVGDFHSELGQLLTSLQFKKLTGQEEVRVPELLQIPHARMLILEEASLKVSLMIGEKSEADKYGVEVFYPQAGHHIYRYRGQGLIMLSLGAQEWKMGAFPHFGDRSNLISAQLILSRFLSWSLSYFGTIGLWGIMLRDGLVVMKPGSPLGGPIFVNCEKETIVSGEGIQKIEGPMHILRLDPLADRTQKISTEDLYGLLLIRCTYFHYEGHSAQVRQLLLDLARSAVGKRFPEKKFEREERI